MSDSYLGFRACRVTTHLASLALLLVTSTRCAQPSRTPGEGGQENPPAAEVPAAGNANTLPNGAITPTTVGNTNIPLAVSPNVAGNANTTPVAPGNPNAPLPNGNDTAITSVAAIAVPQIGFDELPANDNKAVALTFDDGPDGDQGATDLVLDTLKKENLKATFFICGHIGNNDLATNANAQRQLRRIVAEGHTVGNHTYAHIDLSTLPTEAELEAAFTQQKDVYKKVFGPTAPEITMIRAPFGSPFQLNPTDANRVGPVVTRYGVQVGWGMDPKDWSFDHYSTDPAVFNQDVQAVVNAMQTMVTNKQWGIALLHAVHLPSATALPQVITMLRNAGYHFVSVEDVIRSKYGANSASIMAANRKAGTAVPF